MNSLEQYNIQFNDSINKRERLLVELTDNESTIFIKISHDLGFTRKSMSGFFFLELPHNYLLETPTFLWQSWFYNRYIYKQTIKQGREYPLFSLETVYNDMCKLIQSGYFRLSGNFKLFMLKHLIMDLITAYEKLKILTPVNSYTREIRFDELPVFQDINDNVFIEIFYNYILPKYNGVFDYMDQTVPREIKKAAYLFENHWRNNSNGYLIKYQYNPPSLLDNKKIDNQIVIYTENKAILEKALELLTEEQKKFIATCLKSNSKYVPKDICEMLIKKFNLVPNKMNNGDYEIQPYVEEYIFSSLWLWI